MGNKATSVAKPAVAARSFSSKSGAKMHVKARCETYPRTNDVKRFLVPNDKVDWKVDFPEYNPTTYTSASILKNPPYADPDITTTVPDQPLNFNEVDGTINRKSHFTIYQVDTVPLNPMGRTGLKGRGALGRWGPNHAADPIVTRWKRDKAGNQIQKDGKNILQFVCVERKDNGQWAIPGGMVDAGEVINATLKREFGEEALNSLQMPEKEQTNLQEKLDILFSKGEEIYRGYVDDPRNTDNSWMETVALNFHDEDGESLGKIDLCAGDDAANVTWMDLSHELDLYASHFDFLETVAKRHNAYW